MRSEEVLSALDSKTRIEILRILAAGPANVAGVLGELGRKEFGTKYRESVFRALEKLANAGLVEKYYDNEKRGIRYRLLKTRVEIDFKTGTIS